MGRKRLEAEAIREWLRGRSGWKLVQDGKALRKEYKFKSFRDSIVFVNRVATLADRADHHPDLDIRFKRVVVTLSTRSASGITDKDLDLAKNVDFATSTR